MRQHIQYLFSLLIIITVSGSCYAQSISGTVVDENGFGIPYANIYINELATGTSTDFDGVFYLGLRIEGEYSVVISAIGYEPKTISANISEPIDFEIFATLEENTVQMEEIVVRSNKKDPAYGIIKKVIDAKDKYINAVGTSERNIYLKSIETLDITEKKSNVIEEEKQFNKDGSPIDPLEEMQKKLDAEMNKINMVEMQLTLYHQAPKSYKEIRNAFTVYGRSESLFIPNLSEIDFSFYRNLVRLKGISDVPIISPISNTAILSYKYKLIEATVEDDGQLVYKIKVIPRKKGNATVSGMIYINEGLWNINRLELEMRKGAPKFYDKFKFKQTYTQEDSVWIISRQEFDYETKIGGRKNFVGNTVIKVEDFKKNVVFEPKFFGNEISVLTKEALERDSSYWEESRPEPLTNEQKKLVAYQDSVQAWITSDKYLDSLDNDYNRIDLLDVAWDGVGFRNHRKKSQLWIGPIPSLADFKIIGGWRVGPFATFFKRFEDGRMLRSSTRVSVGLQNKDVQGYYRIWTRVDPHKLLDFSFEVGRDFESINFNDAIINQLRSSNYFLNDRIEFGSRVEIFNGLYFGLNVSHNNRQSADRFRTATFITEIIDDQPAQEFEPYEALISELRLSYTPQQRYMTEPTRKVILGSKYPTFHMKYEKGWNGLLGSDIDFDRIELEIEQDIVLGTIGTSKYNIRLGDFLNTNDVRFVDVKRFNQSNPIWQEDPLYNFNALDTALTTTNFYFEGHYIHHFNGALVNNIPLVKLLRVQAVAGAGLLWVDEAKIRHEELFAGLERTFKLGARRRLRVGVYGVLANSNITDTTAAFRFYVDVIDTWRKDWSF